MANAATAGRSIAKTGGDAPRPSWTTDDKVPYPEHDVEIGEYVFHYRSEMGRHFQMEAMRGETLPSTAAALMIPMTVIKRWRSTIKNFEVELELADQLVRRHWQEIGLDGMKLKGFNVNGWLRTMATLFPEEYKDPEGDNRPDLIPGTDEIGKTLIFECVDEVDESDIPKEHLRVVK